MDALPVGRPLTARVRPLWQQGGAARFVADVGIDDETNGVIMGARYDATLEQIDQYLK